MSRQVHVVNSVYGRSGFSSASDICGLHRGRSSAPAVFQPGGRSGYGHSPKSLSNMGGSRRISCSGGYQIGGYGCLGVGHHANYCGQSYDGIYCGIPRSYVELRNHAGSYRNDYTHGVIFNEHLLKPLCVRADPEFQKIRVHEREQMKSLNDRFACFINQVRCLEQKNKVLVTKWNLLQDQMPPVRRDLEPVFENFICSLRKQLDFLLSKQEQMELQLQNMQQSTEEVKCKYEEEINRRIAVENDFVLLKKDVECLFVNKVQLQAKKELSKREIDFLKGVHDKELALLEEQIHCATSIIVQMDNSQNLNMNSILQNVESWYRSIAQRSKEEVNALYKSRYQELQNQRCQARYNLKTNNREIAGLSRRVQRLQCEMEKTKKQVACLQLAICDTEQQGDCTLKDVQEKLDELNSALHKSKDQLACTLRNYQELLNDKLALDIEIATYNSLLEGEENRILSGNPGSVVIVPNSSKVADDRGCETGCGSRSGRKQKSRSGKYSSGGQEKGQNPGDITCYPVGYTSRNISNTVDKHSIPGYEDFILGRGYNSTSGSGHASRSVQGPKGTTAIVGRYVGGYSNIGHLHGHSCNHDMIMSTGLLCFANSSKI